MTVQEKQSLIKDYVSFKTQTYIKNKYKISYNTMKSICIEYNVWDNNRHVKQNKLSGKRKRSVKSNPFENLDNPNVQYWLGMLAADGTICDNSNIQLSLKDYNHIKKYKDFINSNNKIICTIDRRYKTKPKMYKFCFTNNEVKDYLISLGLTPRKSMSLQLNIDLTWHILRGVIDGDGYIGCNRIDIATASITFKDQIVDFLKQNEFTPKVYNRKHYYNNVNDLYTIRIARKNEVLNLLDKIYYNADTFLERKYHKARSIRNY